MHKQMIRHIDKEIEAVMAGQVSRGLTMKGQEELHLLLKNREMLCNLKEDEEYSGAGYSAANDAAHKVPTK